MSNFIETTEMRVLPALISFIMLAVFTAPCFSGIVNLGNIAGMILSGGAMAVFVFFRPFKALAGKLWERPAGRIALCSAAVIAALCIILAAVISIFMVRAMNDRPESSDTTIVVLGCKVKNGAPSRMLRKRLDAAYDYLVDEPDVKVIVSGGKGSDELISEAQCMRDYLVSKGISPERIYMEDKSEDTEQNLRFSKEIIEREGLPEHITIVTDGYHQLRAEMLAKNLEMDAWNISADTSAWLVPTYWVREWFGVTYYVLKKQVLS